MISYDEALKKAKKLKPNIDYCAEFENAYMFAAEAERYDIGGDGPVFILKNDGSAIGSTAYYDDFVTKTIGDEFKI